MAECIETKPQRWKNAMRVAETERLLIDEVHGRYYLTDKDDLMDICGQVQLHSYNGFKHTPSREWIGWEMFNMKKRNKGLMTEAGRAVIPLMKEKFEIKTLKAWIAHPNNPSHKLACRLGFELYDRDHYYQYYKI